MTGTRYHERLGEDLVVVWDGEADCQGRCPSLLADYPRPSTLAPLAVDPLGRPHRGHPHPRNCSKYWLLAGGCEDSERAGSRTRR